MKDDDKTYLARFAEYDKKVNDPKDFFYSKHNSPSMNVYYRARINNPIWKDDTLTHLAYYGVYSGPVISDHYLRYNSPIT